MTKLTKTSKLVRIEDRPSVLFDGEQVLLDAEQGEYQVLRGTARRIWDLLEQPITFGELCSTLETEYNLSPELCEKDLVPFLKDLEESGLLDIKP